MQIYEMLEKVIESQNGLNIWYATESDPSEVGCTTLICGTIENSCSYLCKEDEPFDDGYIADFVAMDDYNTIVFGYKVETD